MVVTGDTKRTASARGIAGQREPKPGKRGNRESEHPDSTVDVGELALSEDPAAAADGLECADILRSFIPEILVLNCDLLWGGYQEVMALINETPRLSQTQMVLIADEEPLDDYAGLIDPLRLTRLSESFQLNDLMTLMETGVRSPRSARQIHMTTPLDCQQGGMQ